MQLWTLWVEFLGGWLDSLAALPLLGSGLAIIALTLMLRTLLLPLSWSSAYGTCVHRKRVAGLRPELERIRRLYGDRPEQMVEQTMKLYRRRGLRMIESRPILGALVQMPVLLGMFSVLREGTQQARFLWVGSLARPDFWIALLAGITTALMMAANPDLPEQTRLILTVVPALIAFVFALKFASGLGLYWVVSNGFTAAQTALVHRTVERRIQSGKLRL